MMESKRSKSDLTIELSPGGSSPPSMQKLMTTDEVAAMTGLSPETLAQWRWLKREIPFVRLGRKCVRYRQSDIDAWLVKRLVSVTSGEKP
jgi:excisionase family DNA binding protein